MPPAFAGASLRGNDRRQRRGLFVAEGFDGVHVGGAVGGVIGPAGEVILPFFVDDLIHFFIGVLFMLLGRAPGHGC